MFNTKGMEEQIIINLQKCSNTFLDMFFNAQSYIASWICAVVIFTFTIFFINKKLGLFYGVGFLFTIGFNYLLKTIINRPRPYEKNMQIINKLQTIGKSFPSGHMVSATFIVLFVLVLFKYLYHKNKLKLYGKKWFKVTLILIGVTFITLTAIARMYLGQHYLTDIVAGVVIGAFGFIACYILLKDKIDF